jgi:PAS domain S-box-containing protein
MKGMNGMGNLIHILHLEDDALDAELIQATLESAGITCQINRVQNRDEFSQALRQGEYDIILGDYRLPTYDGVSALRLARELRPDLPFIFVSGTLGEDAAIESFTQGATDYVLKQRLSRLVPAVERALREAENRRERIRAEGALRESEAKFSTAFRSSPTAVSVSRAQDHVYVDVNDTFLQWTGYTRAEVVGHTSRDLQLWVDPDQNKEFRRLLHTDQQVHNFEYAYRRKDGEVRQALTSATLITLGGEPCVLVQSNDITDRKRAEARNLRLNRLYATLSQINETIVHVRDRETLFREICRVTVEHGQFRLAWIGLIDDATRQVVPVAIAGDDQGYLANVTIGYDAGPPGYGPTGQAIREGQCIICQDITAESRLAWWRDQALQRGYRSLAAVPFRQHGGVIGALTVYAAELQGFDAEDEQLLDEIGQDISYALDALEQEAQRRHAEAQLSQLNAELEQRVLDRTAELAQAHEHLRAILDTVGEGVVFTDRHGAIEYINPAMERLTGYQTTEAIGRNPRIWRSNQTPMATYRQLWNTLMSGEIWQGELINRRKDGALYDAALTAAPLTDPGGQIVGFVGVQRDISRQKELDRLKDQFVSNVSHELRTPLANILLHVGLLERGKPDKLGSYLQTLRREAERLRKLIEDLLDLSRLDRNVAAIQLAPIDLDELLKQLVTDRAALAEQRGLALTYEPTSHLPPSLADASKLIQVASNLLTNALNYTPAGGRVTVEAGARQLEGKQMVAFTVRDTGPGISPQDMSHLFERFYRGASGRQASAPGTGLGLAISQEIMKRLGGRITVESEVGQGAAFTVWLPSA